MRAGKREANSDANPADAGFSLIEVIVALGILAVVLSAGSLQFIKAVAVGRTQQQRQQAISLADQGIEMARAAKPNMLLNGRTQADIHGQFTSPGPINLSQTNEPTAVGGTGPTLLLYKDYTEQNTVYRVTWIVGQCYLPALPPPPVPPTTTTNCGKSNSTGAALVYRVSVSVTWAAGRRQKCTMAGGVCAVVEDTIIDPSIDPLFNNNNG